MTEIENKDPRALEIDVIRIRTSNVTLLSCDHVPIKMPRLDPWQEIETKIQESSLIFVEYFPPELQTTIYQNRFIGSHARKEGRNAGIDNFFNEIGSLAAKHKKNIAVADIANNLPFLVHYVVSMTWPMPAVLATLATKEPSYLPVLILEDLGLLNNWLSLTAAQSEYPNTLEKFLLNMDDARRVLTTRALAQTAKEQPGSNLLYISPHVHVNRIREYLKHPESLSYRIKSRAYSLLPGLDKTTRVYRYDPKEDIWDKISSTPIKA